MEKDAQLETSCGEIVNDLMLCMIGQSFGGFDLEYHATFHQHVQPVLAGFGTIRFIRQNSKE